ncbi:MAG: Rnf-Nqr domain containing protein, partial [Pseudomonadota bacterium]
MASENRKALVDPIIASNPIMVQVLGICSSLAVTSTLKTTI